MDIRIGRYTKGKAVGAIAAIASRRNEDRVRELPNKRGRGSRGGCKNGYYPSVNPPPLYLRTPLLATPTPMSTLTKAVMHLGKCLGRSTERILVLAAQRILVYRTMRTNKSPLSTASPAKAATQSIRPLMGELTLTS